ncbi:MAG: CBS domain-containing protein [Clostridia bacterium]|nr:CBS domain-containing protein [Clostridia bacterium]
MNILFFLRPKSGVTYLTIGNSMRQGLEKMKASGHTEVPVLNKDGTYAGTVSHGDFLWKILEKDFTDMQMAEHEKIDPLVSKKTSPVRINTTMEDLLTKAADQNFVPVVDDFDSFVGIVTRRDIIKYFASKNIN